MDLQPLQRSRGNVWDYQRSHPKPIPSLKAGKHSVGGEGRGGFGWLLGGSPAVLPFPKCLWWPSSGDSHGVWLRWAAGGGLSSLPAAASLELLFKALRIPGKANPEGAEWRRQGSRKGTSGTVNGL